MNLKKIYKIYLIALLMAVFSQGIAASPRVFAAAMPAPEKDSIADVFLGESLTYQIGFWAFDNLAIGTITLRRGADGDYVATLAAHTTGPLLTWLLQDRRDFYVEHMRMSEDGKRFISKTFEKSIETINIKKQSKITVDYSKEILTSTNYENGKETENHVIPLQKGKLYDGPLAAFYNLRFGSYGPFKMGREFNIYTFPKKDGHVPVIHVRIAGQKETGLKLNGNSLNEYLAEVKLDKDLFKSKAGDIKILFSNNSDHVPEEAVAKDVLFFGDVRGKLTATGVAAGFAKPASVE